MAAKLDAVSENIEALKKRLQEEKNKKRRLETQLQNERTQLVGALILEEANRERGIIDKATLYTLLASRLTPEKLELFPELVAFADSKVETESETDAAPATGAETSLAQATDDVGPESFRDPEPAPVRP